MKAKIMDYETAKAEVLARENNNPYLANDRTVWGVSHCWKGWGQVRDIYKGTDYANNVFRDVEDGYDFPIYLLANVTPEDVLRYGEIIINEEFVEYGAFRIRIISYDGSIYYHKMMNGEVIEFKEIGLAME